MWLKLFAYVHFQFLVLMSFGLILLDLYGSKIRIPRPNYMLQTSTFFFLLLLLQLFFPPTSLRSAFLTSFCAMPDFLYQVWVGHCTDNPVACELLGLVLKITSVYPQSFKWETVRTEAGESTLRKTWARHPKSLSAETGQNKLLAGGGFWIVISLYRRAAEFDFRLVTKVFWQ